MSIIKSGHIYAPYVPLQVTQTISPLRQDYSINDIVMVNDGFGNENIGMVVECFPLSLSVGVRFGQKTHTISNHFVRAATPEEIVKYKNEI